ncbi:MAG: sulfite exporter TauE/SafE family protein [Syntrophaceae bacterium]|nr:sulfite exporter TauE/SafE family protein [Syntrophaceae bacterium]
MFFDFLAPLLIGFVGSLHCLGMCGPLIMAYSLHIRTDQTGDPLGPSIFWVSGLTHHAAFHAGRLLTYGFLGALAAGLAQSTGLSQTFSGLRSSITLAGGAVMVLFGLFLLRVIPFSLFPLPSFGRDSLPGRAFSRLLGDRTLLSKALLGLATGFLPCMLSWAMVMKAMTIQNPILGFLTMVFFGLGTVPALFLTGLSASFLSLKIRLLGERVAAVSVMAMGFILIFKGSKYFV